MSLVASESNDGDVEKRVARLMKGAIDLHIHSGPSVMSRLVDHIEVLEAAAEAGMRAVLFKDHFYSAAPIVELLRERYKNCGVAMFSGVPLNDTSGGLNPYAVDHGLKLGARMVWMPTFSAANHIRHNRRKHLLATKVPMLPPKLLTVVDEDGKLKDVVKVILDQIAEYDAVLSGGHLHISEIFPLFEEAKKRGVKRRLINHPTFTLDGDLTDMADLARDGVFIEHSLCMFIEGARAKRWGPDDMKAFITAGTVEQTFLGSDLGQAKNPSPVDGFRAGIRMLIGLGYDDDAIRRLVGGNAARLIGLEEAERR